MTACPREKQDNQWIDMGEHPIADYVVSETIHEPTLQLI